MHSRLFRPSVSTGRFMQLFMVGCVCVMHVGVYLGES